MTKKALFVVANRDFRDEELNIPMDIIGDKGVEITIVAGNIGTCVGKFGTQVTAKLTLKEAHASDYNVVVFVGGNGAYKEYYQNEDYLKLAREAKVIAAICIAPVVIADSGVLATCRVTSWNDELDNQKEYLEAKGAIFTGERVTISGNIITANGPQAAERFAQAILEKI